MPDVPECQACLCPDPVGGVHECFDGRIKLCKICSGSLLGNVAAYGKNTYGEMPYPLAAILGSCFNMIRQDIVKVNASVRDDIQKCLSRLDQIEKRIDRPGF
jgi:hypothetical protein